MAKYKIKSYEEYLRSYASVPDEDYADTMQKAEQTFEASKSTYGKNAESLGTRGLTASGYAAYLTEEAKKEKLRATAEAEKQRKSELVKGYESYQSYLTAEKQRVISRERQAQRTILSSGTLDPQLAYDMALGAGLDESHAKTLAERAIALNVENKKNEIFDYIRTQSITPARAVMYAEAFGLPESVLDEIREYATRLQTYSSNQRLENMSGSYSDESTN